MTEMTTDTLDLPWPAATPASQATSAPGSAGTPEVELVAAHWVAERLQVINWGGFQGHHTLEFAPGSTLISGATGVGKSTLQDAYIAVMMPSDTPFNGASNAAASGRARSAEQRNILSYLRGKTDTVADGVDTRDKTLRGTGKPTWGAIAVTFASDLGDRFTVMRTYWVPNRATGYADISVRLFTVDGPVNLAVIEPFASTASDKHFATDDLKTVITGLRVYDSYDRFAQAMHTRLGIGAGGDGARAMRLLATIQASQHIGTVDELYKRLVLENPDTFEKADAAIGHFDDLEAAYEAMVTEQHKVALLTPIVALHTERDDARTQAHALDTLGINRPGDTPFLLWRTSTHARLYDLAITANAADAAATKTQLADNSAQEQAAKAQLDLAAAAYARAGGAAIADLDKAIAVADNDLTVRTRHAGNLAADIAILGTPPASRPDLDNLHKDGQVFLADLEGERERLRTKRDALVGQLQPLTDRIADVERERASFRGRDGRIPDHLHTKRIEAARLAGISADQLKFVGELINVPTHQQPWRTAIETVLYGLATTLLVPDVQLPAVRAAINPLDWRGRVHFIGVAPGYGGPVQADADTIAGKLEYADSPYRGWIVDRIASTGVNALCVTRPADLVGPGRRVTATGQVSDGQRGAHGRIDKSNVIGFTNAEILTELDTQIADLTMQKTDLLEAIKDLNIAGTKLDATATAYKTAAKFTWDDIDTATVAATLDQLRSRKHQLEAASDTLGTLKEQMDTLAGEHEQLKRAGYTLDEHAKALDKRRGVLFEEQDTVKTVLFRLEDDGLVTIDEQAIARLDREYEAAANKPTDLEEFDAAIARLARTLNSQHTAAMATIARTGADLEDKFARYQERWPDPNRGSGVEAYPEFVAILDELVSTGLHERRSVWRKRLVDWSGQDLVPLRHSLTRGVDEIARRIDDINDILAKLPFGPGKDRLQIRVRRLTTDQQTRFTRQLSMMAALSSQGLTDDQLEPRFNELRAFIATIRRRDDPHLTRELAASADRDKLLDVRRHVEIIAERQNPDGSIASTHQSLSDKSGGESQELVAFIVGAALRYRLGDELASRPRFAPVFLDEAFIKSDSEFAGRAVRAWQGLGFQLVVSAPFDKFTALETHMERILAVTKNQTSNYSFVDVLRDQTDTTGTTS